MKFYNVPFSKNIRPPGGAEYPCALLVKDNWNDFGYHTSFVAHICMSPGDEVEIGFTKILQKAATSTELPKTPFDSLQHEFCSLGQSIDFYRTLRNKIPAFERDTFLRGVNDVAFNPALASRLRSDPGFETSLLRFPEARKLFEEGLKVLDDTPQSAFLFTFRTRLDGAAADHIVDFDFLSKPGIPNRINVLVGKNGTGKTKLLGNLADAISGGNTTSGSFVPERPPFSKAIGIAYNVFDPFVGRTGRPSRASFQYFGVFTDDCRLKSREDMENDCANAIASLIRKKRIAEWIDAVESALTGDFSTGRIISTVKTATEDSPQLYQLQQLLKSSGLSSGQLIVTSVLSHIVAHTERDSVVLLDEPENHLHPNAISGLMQGLHKALELTHSFAIIATHSPLILQQIPACYVRLFRRFDLQPEVSQLDIECFGENLTTITDEVFSAFATPSLFVSWLATLQPETTIEEIEQILGSNLGLTARSLIEARKRTPQP